MNNKESKTMAWPVSRSDQLPFLQSPAEGRLVSTSIPAPGISAISFLNHAEGQERFFWQNGLDQTIFAGLGVAVEMMAWGEARFRAIRHKAATLFANADLDLNQNPAARPRLFGGFAFRDDFTPDNTWAVFHPAHFILPHFQLIQNEEGSWLTINAVLSANEKISSTRDQLREALAFRYEIILLATKENQKSEKKIDFSGISYPMNYATWAEKIGEAVSTINAGELDKVVLARVCELRSQQRVDVRQALDYLNHNFPECTRFLFEPRPSHAFYGATPELLVQVRNRQANTMALAGSIRRGNNPEEDAYLSQQLLASNKDRLEQNLVFKSILRRLQPIAKEIETEETPRIYTLSYIHHLLTPIKAILNKPLGVLPLVEILHPTPALGGSPRRNALEFIRFAEPVPRGWYAGPIGWIDHDLDGEFAVAIRSAVAQRRRVWLYAGAGIVVDSDPAGEWAETALKFQPMFAALGLEKEEIEAIKEIQLS